MRNFFKKRRVNRRTRAAIVWWNERHETIIRDIEREQQKPKKRRDEHRSFRWTQLVWQEIQMFIFHDQQVTAKDIEDLAEVRGFTQLQRFFLEEAVIHVGLGKNLRPRFKRVSVKQYLPVPTGSVEDRKEALT